MAKRYVGNDLAKVYEKPGSRRAIETLYWGDAVNYLRTEGGRPVIGFRTRDKLGQTSNIEAYLPKGTVLTDTRPMTVRFVDVGQGDGAIVETPKRKLMVVDGGEGEHLRRYMSVAFRKRPTPVEAIVATHGDADHYSGLTKLLEGYHGPVVAPKAIYHNGLVKRPSRKPNKKRRKDAEMFGKTRKRNGELYCTELVDDIRTVADAEMNRPFRSWKAAVHEARSPDGKKVKMKRLAFGSTLDLFEDEGIQIEVLGPVTEQLGNAQALRFLRRYPGSSSLSASHTVNGHSVVLRLRYGNVNFLFAADLNEESEELLLSACRENGRALTSEVLKVPHHGSADFSPAMLRAVSPVASIVSSGDESVRTEYIHPRAGLVGALGRASRQGLDRPLVYVTEMVAFFEQLDRSEKKDADDAGIAAPDRLYRKLQYGIVHVRTDGERMLVVVPSGKEDFVEAHAFTVDSRGVVESVGVDGA